MIITHDPSAHRYQMAVNDKKVFGEMLENLETISHLITRYAMFEELYLQPCSRSPKSQKLCGCY